VRLDVESPPCRQQRYASALRRRVDQGHAELRAVRIGARLEDRLRIAWILSYAHLRLGRGRRLLGWIPAGNDPPRELRLRTGLTVLARRRDAVPLYEQFGLDVYGVALPFGGVETILDLGANVGFATLALAASHPGARFVCVEPEPETRRLLRENVSRNGIDAQVIGAAVVGTPGSYRVVPGRAPASSTVESAVSGGIDGITVASLLADVGIETVDLMKIDVEGAEWGVFDTAAEWAANVRALIGELHPPSEAARADALLAPHGFQRLALPDGLRFRDVCCWVRA
jgi:FkbM family methyltransferase